MFSNKELEQMRAIAYGGYRRVSNPSPRYSPNGMVVNRNSRAGQIDYDFYRGRGTTGMPGFNQKQDPVSRNFGRIAEELGLKSVNSINDLQAMYDYLGRSTASKTVQEAAKNQSVTAQTSNTSGPTVNNPETVSTPGQKDETYYDPKDSTGSTGFDINNLGRFGGRTDRFGMADVIGAYKAGYSQGDIFNFLSSQQDNPGWSNEGGGFNSQSASYKALQQAAGGQVTTGFYDPSVTGHGGDHDKYFGMADLMGNRKAGFSDRQIMAFLDANPNVLRGGNVKGAQGGLYETLKAGLPPEPKDPTNLMIGSTGLGNSGSASGVKPKRSNNSQSGRSSYGTSQYNRSNFGTSRSPLAIGLNI